jgi:hypothetical protein
VRRAAVFNFISLVFLLLTIITMVLVGAVLFAAPPEAPVAALPTVVPDSIFPTLTPSNTHTATFTPTLPPTFTSTPSFTPSITPSITPSFTFTASLTPSITPTASNTFTASPTATATGPTETPPPSLSPFLFGVPNGVAYNANGNSLQCAWQSVAGQVIDLAGAEVPPGRYQIRVFGGVGFERVVTPGSNSLFGLVSGWEVQTDNVVNNNTYFARLETVNGTEISESIQITFASDCTRNVAVLTFRQLREP